MSFLLTQHVGGTVKTKWYGLRGLVMIVGVCAASVAYGFDILQPLPKEVPVPAGNPLIKPKIELGRQLYFDTRLSVNGSLSCNGCHDVTSGGADHRAVSPGATGKIGKRNAPTVWNVGYQTVLYWDGRARSLEEQLRGHLLDETTMAMMDERVVADRLAQIPGYRAQFQRVFGASANVDTAAQALASYIRTLRTPGSAFDRYITGKKRALSAQAQRGLARVELNTTLKDDEVADIVAFLESLTGRLPAQTLPQLPPTPHNVVWPWQRPLAEIASDDRQPAK